MSKRPLTPPPGDKPVRTAPPAPPAWRHMLWLVVLVVALLYIVPAFVHTTSPTSLTYSQFLTDVAAHKVKNIDIPSPASAGANVTATGTLANKQAYTTVIPGGEPGSAVAGTLQKAGVSISYQAPGSSTGALVLQIVLFLVLPIALVFFVFRRMARTTGRSLQGVMGVGRSRAKVFDAEQPKTKFTDVAGYEGVKLEIREVVDFLQRPSRYKSAGAMAPRGVLMVGPPGTGKTLLARAVAGEANVPFLSVAGSSFVEMFVGVGAARVRDLFEQARKRAPAIIFMDEIDAIGQRRGGSAVVSNDEREQTLNQLLAEMDGFDPTSGIVVLAATNRPEVLDPALLRPGRFDREVVIPLPTLPERVAILQVHSRDKKLGPDVDLQVVARGTPGFSGADLANLVNEAAIVAVRANRDVLSQADFSDARDRIILGRREGSNVLIPDEQHAVAVHEAGHALVAVYSEKADPVAKVTILPAGQALGVTEQLPLVERHLYGEDYLYDMLAVFLGGRASEIVVLGQGSTGASNDLAKATELAAKMVREFGLSPLLGPVGYPSGGSVFLGDGGNAFSSRPFSDETQAQVDGEISRMLREAQARSISILTEHRAALDELVALLKVNETVDGSMVYKIAGRAEPSTGGGMTVAPDLNASTPEASRAASSEDS